MARRLLVVEDVFAIAGRGVIVVPHIPFVEGFPRRVTVELRRPDGTSARVEAFVDVPRFSPPHPTLELAFQLPELGKADVPIGTEVWLVSDP